ncbi:hypothetical protein ES703_97281 [subsurface metagenome]
MKQFFFVFAVLIWASYPLGSQSIGLAQEADGCRHLPSSVLFPLHDELTQLPMTPDDYVESRGDISVEYSHSTIPLEITLYVYPALHSLDDEFTSAVNEIYSALSPQFPQTKPRVSVESSLEILGYSQEFRYIKDFRSEKQALVSTVEVYQTNGWFVKARMTVSHDYTLDGRRLVRELLDTMVWPEPIRTLPITFSSFTFYYQGEDFKDGFFGYYLPLVRVLQEEPRLSAGTVEALIQYEKQALLVKRFKEWSTGSYIATGVGGISLLIGLGYLVYALIADPGPPFRELGLVNRDLMGSR